MRGKGVALSIQEKRKRKEGQDAVADGPLLKGQGNS